MYIMYIIVSKCSNLYQQHASLDIICLNKRNLSFRYHLICFSVSQVLTSGVSSLRVEY